MSGFGHHSALLLGLALAFSAGSPAAPLDQFAETIAKQTITRFGAPLNDGNLALTLIDLRDRKHPVWGSFHGVQPIYPASVVKLFYMVAAHAQIESGKLIETAELDRAMHDMIVDSSNDATQLVFDMITGTTGGPELPPDELRQWLDKRNVVNRYFTSLGYTGINVNQKTFAEGAYGREHQSRGPNEENGNRLTTNAVARLLLGIMQGDAVSAERSSAMGTLLHRDPFASGKSQDEQATGFLGHSLPPGSQLWSKAGWTSSSRHDAAFIRLPNGAEYLAVVFTRDNSDRPQIIHSISTLLVQHFSGGALN